MGRIGLAKSPAIEGGTFCITVNTVRPGLIATGAVRQRDPEITARITGGTPLDRPGRPGETGEVAAFPASETSSLATGAAIPVTGGLDQPRFRVSVGPRQKRLHFESTRLFFPVAGAI